MQMGPVSGGRHHLAETTKTDWDTDTVSESQCKEDLLRSIKRDSWCLISCDDEETAGETGGRIVD